MFFLIPPAITYLLYKEVKRTIKRKRQRRRSMDSNKRVIKPIRHIRRTI